MLINLYITQLHTLSLYFVTHLPVLRNAFLLILRKEAEKSVKYTTGYKKTPE